MFQRIRKFRNLSQPLLLLVVVFAAGGCNLGRFASHALGEDAVPAKYTLQKLPLLVMVKDAPDPTGLVIESEELTSAIERQFESHQIAPLVPSSKVSDLRSNRLAEFAAMSPAEIGKAVGASQVLLVKIVGSDMYSEAVRDMVKGKISASVKVISTADGKALFPHDGSDEGETISYETPMLRLTDQTRVVTVQRNVDAGAADRIAKLFYKYKPDDE